MLNIRIRTVFCPIGIVIIEQFAKKLRFSEKMATPEHFSVEKPLDQKSRVILIQ